MLGLMITSSPFLTNCPIPPNAAITASTMALGLWPRATASRVAEGEVDGTGVDCPGDLLVAGLAAVPVGDDVPEGGGEAGSVEVTLFPGPQLNTENMADAVAAVKPSAVI